MRFWNYDMIMKLLLLQLNGSCFGEQRDPIARKIFMDIGAHLHALVVGGNVIALLHMYQHFNRFFRSREATGIITVVGRHDNKSSVMMNLSVFC